MIQKVSKFKTSDGQLFDNQTAARQHEAGLDAMTKLRETLNGTLQTGRPDAVLKHLLAEADAVCKVLQSYRKKTAKAA